MSVIRVICLTHLWHTVCSTFILDSADIYCRFLTSIAHVDIPIRINLQYIAQLLPQYISTLHQSVATTEGEVTATKVTKEEEKSKKISQGFNKNAGNM